MLKTKGNLTILWILGALLFMMFLSACTMNYQYEYEKLKDPNVKVYPNLAAVLEDDFPTEQIKVDGQPFAGFLRDNSLVWRLPDENISRFSLYRFYADKDKKIKITLSALCSCWGTKRSIINPRFVVFNRDLTWKKEFDWDFYPEQLVQGAKIRLISDMKVTIPEGGSYFLLVYGDNSKEGQFLMTEVSSKVTAPGLISRFNVNSSPVGQYEIILEEI